MTTEDSRRRRGTAGDGRGLSVDTGNGDELLETVGASGFERRIMIPGF